MDRRLATLFLFLIVVPRVIAQPQGGASAEQWAFDVARQLYRYSIGIALAGLFASVLALAIAYLVPSLTLRNFLIHFAGTSLMGAIISLVIVLTIKLLVLIIVSFISPEAATQLSTAFQQIGA